MRYIRRGSVILGLVIVLSFFAVHIVEAVTAEPGSDGDPIVTQSYVDTKIAEIGQKITELGQKISAIEEKLAQPAAAEKFTVVDVPAGKQLIGGAGAEIILRQGKATVVASASGGVSDVTHGADLMTGWNFPDNHLMIVARDDGRGLKAVTDVKVLIKGTYTIK